jgi:hypothetical protein
MRYDYNNIQKLLVRGDVFELEEKCKSVHGFPDGVDNFVGRRWIINAIGGGAIKTIEWMLSKKVELNFIDEEGNTPLISALERRPNSRYSVLELLLKNGANPNLHDVRYTVAHLARVS